MIGYHETYPSLKKFLILEDDKQLNKLYEIYKEKNNIRLDIATTIDEALVYVKTNNYFRIYVDYELENQGRMEVGTDFICAIRDKCQAEIVACSYNENEKLLEAGADRAIGKTDIDDEI